MSKASTLYDNLMTLMGTQLTSSVRLPNPYKVEENTEMFLKAGYGLRLGAASANRFSNHSVGVDRAFTVVLTRKLYAKENDAPAKGSAEKQIFEDMLLVSKAIEADLTVGGAVLTVIYAGDTGIEFVAKEKDNFLKLETEFTAKFAESTT